MHRKELVDCLDRGFRGLGFRYRKGIKKMSISSISANITGSFLSSALAPKDGTRLED